MTKFLAGRLLQSCLVLFGVSILVFALARLMPGDPARLALGPTASESQVRQLRHEMHLDDPLPEQYVRFAKGVMHGDLGISLQSHDDVTLEVRRLFPATLELVLWAAALMVLIGLPLGVVAARYRDALPDHVTRVLAMLFAVTPTFIWAVLFMLIFSYKLGWTPISGRLTDGMAPPPHVTGLYVVDAAITGQWHIAGDALAHLVLPSVSLALAGIGQAARMMRTSMIETYGKTYVELARAFGLAGSQINFKYALRPALVPTLTIMGLDVSAALGSAFLVETVFGWPGIAQYGVQAVMSKDLNAIIGTVMVLAAFFLIVNTLVDLVLPWLNPRARLGARS
ncbi:ABC transporter permease [Burkholderia sp. PU8-34]